MFSSLVDFRSFPATGAPSNQMASPGSPGISNSALHTLPLSCCAASAEKALVQAATGNLQSILLRVTFVVIRWGLCCPDMGGPMVVEGVRDLDDPAYPSLMKSLE
jgi:hypothetical protein